MLPVRRCAAVASQLPCQGLVAVAANRLQIAHSHITPVLLGFSSYIDDNYLPLGLALVAAFPRLPSR